jgi:hypothetical protein
MKTSKADKYFSLFIRLRDADENRAAKCCTCGKYVDVKYADCGHFIKRQHQATRFSEMNCHTQCKNCNSFEQGRNEVYEKFLIKKYGQDKVNLLKSEGTKTVKRTKLDLDYIAVYFKQKAIELSKQKSINLW